MDVYDSFRISVHELMNHGALCKWLGWRGHWSGNWFCMVLWYKKNIFLLRQYVSLTKQRLLGAKSTSLPNKAIPWCFYYSLRHWHQPISSAFCSNLKMPDLQLTFTRQGLLLQGFMNRTNKFLPTGSQTQMYIRIIQKVSKIQISWPQQ